MSTQFEVPGQQSRPSAVTMAAYAQFAVGGLALIATILQFVQTQATVTAMREELTRVGVSSQDVDGVTGLTYGISVGAAVLSLLFAVAVAVMGVFNLKGKNGARVTTWVLAGIGLLCGICGSIGGAMGSMSAGGGSPADSDQLVKAMDRAVDSLPGWYTPVNLVLALLNVALYLAIIILLALPVANDFFRKPKPQMDVMLPPEAYRDEPTPPRPSTDEPSGPDGPEPPK